MKLSGLPLSILNVNPNWHHGHIIRQKNIRYPLVGLVDDVDSDEHN